MISGLILEYGTSSWRIKVAEANAITHDPENRIIEALIVKAPDRTAAGIFSANSRSEKSHPAMIDLEIHRPPAARRWIPDNARHAT